MINGVLIQDGHTRHLAQGSQHINRLVILFLIHISRVNILSQTRKVVFINARFGYCCNYDSFAAPGTDLEILSLSDIFCTCDCITTIFPTGYIQLRSITTYWHAVSI